jgi:hypothetical protein
MPKFLQKLLFPVGAVDRYMENYAIIAVDRQFGYKRGNVPGMNSVGEVPKTVFFDCVG